MYKVSAAAPAPKTFVDSKSSIHLHLMTEPGRHATDPYQGRDPPRLSPDLALFPEHLQLTIKVLFMSRELRVRVFRAMTGDVDTVREADDYHLQ